MDPREVDKPAEAGEVLSELDRLAAKLERTALTMAELRQEREQLLDASGARTAQALLRRIEEWKRAEEENVRLHEERRQAATRLRALIDKVDMLPRES
ncbi:MAG: hypothetical protein KA123_03025 [Candidatus Eisenbacteria bacterium]|nr:hypothetical protein [Candidatus Eisenbacteria bacterium]